MAPQTQKQWTVQGIAKDFSNLTLNKEAAIPELGDHDVLVKCENDLSLMERIASLTSQLALDFSSRGISELSRPRHRQGNCFHKGTI
jgi:hypothetical protein